MTASPDIATAPPTAEQVQQWLMDKIAARLGVDSSAIAIDSYFDDLDLDSTEALVLSGELEAWLGRELEATALWYHPTIEQLARYIAEGS
jgi:acyl carrier protein